MFSIGAFFSVASSVAVVAFIFASANQFNLLFYEPPEVGLKKLIVLNVCEDFQR